MPRGTLFLVVGPSGAGKDTLIEEACRRNPQIFLMPRIVTRRTAQDSDPTVSPEEFATLKRDHAFSLSWDANGIRYGIERDLEERLKAGQSVLLNGSRTIVSEARARFEPIRIIHVTARFDILSRRLRQRGREDADAIENRLGRAERDAPHGPDVITVDNSGALADGITAFLAALQQRGQNRND